MCHVKQMTIVFSVSCLNLKTMVNYDVYVNTVALAVSTADFIYSATRALAAHGSCGRCMQPGTFCQLAFRGVRLDKCATASKACNWLLRGSLATLRSEVTARYRIFWVRGFISTFSEVFNYEVLNVTLALRNWLGRAAVMSISGFSNWFNTAQSALLTFYCHRGCLLLKNHRWRHFYFSGGFYTVTHISLHHCVADMFLFLTLKTVTKY